MESIPEPDRSAAVPAGLRELQRRGVVRKIVRNDPSAYRTPRRISTTVTALELLDWDREDRR